MSHWFSCKLFPSTILALLVHARSEHEWTLEELQLYARHLRQTYASLIIEEVSEHFVRVAVAHYPAIFRIKENPFRVCSDTYVPNMRHFLEDYTEIVSRSLQQDAVNWATEYINSQVMKQAEIEISVEVTSNGAVEAFRVEGDQEI